MSAESPFGRHRRAISTKAERMLSVIGARGVELSVALVGDEAIQGLNRTYRKKDKPTDVLSFPQHEDPKGTMKRGVSLGLIGDVIIALPQATRQAKEHGHSLEAELTVLLAHGLLHLFGFDHRNDAEEREMNAFARVLEAAAESPRPLSWRLSVV